MKVQLFHDPEYRPCCIRFGSWVRPLVLLHGTRDALVMAFSTASSTATMPLTYECLKDRVGLRAESACLGALVGANFNHDGTALYEAMCALFIAQAIGLELSLGKQVMVDMNVSCLLEGMQRGKLAPSTDASADAPALVAAAAE